MSSIAKWCAVTATDSALVRPAVVPPPVAGDGFRPEVQALRAAAVLLVVAFHLWPDQIRGGFAGVDVFFVISGFLITGHLTRELSLEGTIRLPAFYARRARRLLPAALTVLLASAVGVFTLVPMTLWPRTFHEIMASALYFENWSLAFGSIDYFAAENPPTLVQHFWSLSVEEQFYLVWPLLFLLAGATSRLIPARWPRSRLLLLAVFPATVLGTSLAWSGLHHGTGAEYFSTFTRAWEFAAGGILALAIGTSARASTGDPSRWWTKTLSWLGWAAVVGTGLLLTETMRFPGWVALIPVLGTVAVIAAGTPTGRFSPGGVIRNRVVQFLGGISYSLYLWHWPVIILFGRDSGGLLNNGTSRFLLLGVSLVLAVASTYLIETPLRRTSRPRRHRTGWTLGFAAVGMALVTGITVIGHQQVQAAQVKAERQIEAIKLDPPDCFGAASMDPTRPACREAGASGQAGTATPSAAAAEGAPASSTTASADNLLVPSPIAAEADAPKTCLQQIDKSAVEFCVTGPSASVASREVAVVADSHGMALMPALQKVAEDRNWRLIAILKGSCPLTNAVREMSKRDADSCVKWNKGVQTWLAKHPRISEVIVTASSFNKYVPEDRLTGLQTATQGYLQAWDKLPKSIHRIVVIRDVPRPRSDVVACASKALATGRPVRSCGLPASRALLDDPAARAAPASGRNVQLIDLSQYFCDDYCSPAIGGAFVYRDGHHLTATFARSLTPYLEAELRP